MTDFFRTNSRLFVGRDSSVDINYSLCAGRSGDRIPLGARYSEPIHTGPGVHLSSLQWVPALPGGKAAGEWRWPPTRN